MNIFFHYFDNTAISEKKQHIRLFNALIHIFEKIMLAALRRWFQLGATPPTGFKFHRGKNL
jgi:hypothetical protein